MDDRKIEYFELKNRLYIKHSCEACEYNFDGICANHIMPSNVIDDVYGLPIEETKKLFPRGCDGYRLNFEDWCNLQKINKQLRRKK